MSNDEIEQFLSSDDYFDPKLLFRFLEIFFNISIFLFSPSGFEIPNSKLFSIRTKPISPKKCLLIYCHSGSEIDSLPHPQCEIIVASNSNPSFFSEDVSKHLFDLWSRTYSVVSINSSLGFSLNKFSQFNPYSFFSSLGEVKNQILDSYGKLRGFIVSINNSLGTVIFPPNQPVYLREASGKPPLFDSSIISTIQRKFSISSIVEKNSSIIGFWIPVLDQKNGIFFLITPFEIPQNLSLTQRSLLPSLLVSNSSSLVFDFCFSKRTVNILLQIINWLLLLWRRSISEFIQLFVEADVNINLRFFPRRLPNVQTFEEAIDWLSKEQKLEFISRTQIQLPSSFLQKSIKYFISRTYLDIRGLRISIPTRIERYFETYFDFTKRKSEEIFSDRETLLRWKIISRMSNFVSSSLFSPEETIFSDPILYVNSYSDRKQILLVQNVIGGKVSAITVSQIWYSEKRNVGAFEKTNIPPTLPVIEYGLSVNGTLRLVSETRQTPGPYLSILQYPNGYWAAILPLAILPNF
jgi:hypothetical protein